MRRRKFLVLLGGTAAAWPLAETAQASTTPFIGFLSSRSPSESSGVIAAFRQGLGESGFVEGQNLAIAFRWAEGHYDRLQALAAERDRPFRGRGTTLCRRRQDRDDNHPNRIFRRE
jgi:putative tryptophan/tyrosine transport system substrate-binding protein